MVDTMMSFNENDYLMVVDAELYLCLGMPSEVETVGLTGYRQGEGKRIMIHYVVSHIVQLCIKA